MLHTGLQVSHLEVAVDDVDQEVREPGRLLSRGLHKQLVEQRQRLLPEVVTSEKLKGQKGLSAEKTLSNEKEAAISYRVVSQVYV